MKRGGPDHPKLYALAEALDIRRPLAVGYLELLFHFTSQYAPRGDIGRYPDKRIAAAMDWPGKPEKLLAALLATGWLDRDSTARLVVHDWSEHADRTTLQRLSRSKRSTIKPDHIDTSEVCTQSDPKIRTLPEPEPEPEPEPYVRSHNGNGHHPIPNPTESPNGVLLPEQCSAFLAKLNWRKGSITDEQVQAILSLDPYTLPDLDSPTSLPGIFARLDQFQNHFWPNYWKKVALKAARESWMRVTEDFSVIGDILRAVGRQTPGMLKRPSDKRPYPATWLNQQRWKDEIEESDA